MTAIALEHLQQHIRMSLDQYAGSDAHRRPWVAMAYRGTPAWQGVETFRERGLNFRTATARSLLELRAQLHGLDPAASERVIVIADLPNVLLPADLRARLMHADLREIDPWRVLMSEFKATKADPRIRANHELALALLQNRPAGGFQAVTTGTLDVHTVWGCVCQQVLGLPTSDPSPRDLLTWAIDDLVTAKLRAAPSSLREAAAMWLEERNPLSALLVRVATRVAASDLIPIGVVCGVVHHEIAHQHPDLLRAQGRLEQITGHEAVALKEAREWLGQAARALEDLPDEAQRRLRKRSDALLAQVGASSHADLSPIAPLGYEQRLAGFARVLSAHVAGESTDQALIAAGVALKNHWDGKADTHRQNKVTMAIRLARWLRVPVENPASLTAAMEQYTHHLAYVDWARHGLVGGDPVAELQQAYAKVHEQTLARRESFNQRFAELAAAWNRTPDQHPEILCIEDIAQRVIAPLAAETKVLVLVMDGMSWAVAHELIQHIETKYWTLRTHNHGGVLMPGMVMSTVPSVTEYARTSLLCGTLLRGDADDERRGFAENHDLRSISSTSNPPVIFHRRHLEEDGRQGLNTDISDALANQKQRIVGVVLNAVDDYLAKDDFGPRTWNIESIRVFLDLLEAARLAKRAIVLCSDHGHVLDQWASGTGGTPVGGERWHTGAVRDGEINVSGPRLSAYNGGVVAPWTERVRYGVKKNGYHGGISPQEVLAPCVVMAHHDIDHWHEVHRKQPSWWSLDLTDVPVSQPTAISQVAGSTAGKPVAKRENPGQQYLFTVEPVAGSSTPASVTWVHRLLGSEVYKLASLQAGRRRPDDVQVQTLLLILDAAPGGQVSERALAEAVNIPAIRMGGLIAQVQRMINIEGYQIVSYTADRGHIRLDTALAKRQFEIGDAP